MFKKYFETLKTEAFRDAVFNEDEPAVAIAIMACWVLAVVFLFVSIWRLLADLQAMAFILLYNVDKYLFPNQN